DGTAGLDLLRKHRVGVLLTDLMMPQTSGMDLLRAAKTIAPETEVVLMTAYGTVENAVDAMKQGAYDFVTKPLKRAQIVRVVNKALEKRSLVQENRSLCAQLAAHKRRTLIGQSLAWRRTMDIVMQAAPSVATVLLLGESGTGKELLARAIHDGSPRAKGPFIPVNCAALPETILEAELFGYEKGAFTGAAGRKEGRFELADGGTLFLDEVADLSPVTQPKILRVLQEGEFERVGGTRTIRVDVRIVTATNQDLTGLVRDRRFREDLFYRLNVITIVVPPLRDRKEDIPVLARHFLRVYAAKNNRRLEDLSDEALGCLEAYSWPGNVRELENVIERAVVLARGSRVEVADLPESVADRPVMLVRGPTGDAGPQSEAGASGTSGSEGVFKIRVGTPLAEVEQRMLEETLRLTKGNKTLTARLLGIDPKTVFRKLKAGEVEDAGTGESGSDDRPTGS
ncbi:MAG TPA: sigma-54 dependent transcriptional regulator, partial [Methylomirabilota bacterium]|nr:sigma-54 dependent transcriptional regulator [Methylomirabilota bacterium]